MINKRIIISASCRYTTKLRTTTGRMEEDLGLFKQWAMDTLRHAAISNNDCSEATIFPSLQALREASHAAEMVQELISAAPASSWSSGDTTDGSSGGNNPPGAAMDHDAWPPTPNSARRATTPTRRSSGTNNLPVSWNFGAASALPGSDGVLAAEAAPTHRLPDIVSRSSPPTRRAAGAKGAGSMSTTPYAQDHIIAERKRREKINQRFIELSTVIPGLKKVLIQIKLY